MSAAAERLVRGFQWDLGRQMERVDFMLDQIPRYADWGYDQVYLYLEDAFDFPSVPGVGRKGALTPRQMETLTRAADRYGMKVVPVVPLLGHAAYLMKTPRLRQLAEKRDASGNPLQCGQICPLHADTVAVARKLLRDVAPYCTAGIAHVGLDESFEIGSCPQCREEVKRIGLARHFANHIRRLHDACRGLGLRMGMWGDMLYYMLDAIPLLPKDIVVYDWYYYPFRRLPKVELYNFAEVDLTGRLGAAGIDVYGCPNSGPFSREPITPFKDRLRNVISWWDYAHRKNAKGFMVSSWCATRTSPELNTLVDAAAASLWLNPGVIEPQRLLEQGIRRVWGPRPLSVARLVGSVEKYQYTGYYRWQTYDNWRALANGDSAAPFRREEQHFRNLVQRAGTERTSVPFVNMLAIRHYVARKDLFLSESSEQIFRARRLVARKQLAAARACLREIQTDSTSLAKANRQASVATQRVWRRTRPMSEANPTEQMLLTDRRKLAELGRFLKQAKADPSMLRQANPLTGQWHLLFWVRTTEPALQGTVVQIPDGKGGWKGIHTLWSLEFTAEAGNAKADFRRHHSVAVEWDGRQALELRFGVRGFGRLEMYAAELTDGVQTLLPRQVVLGGGAVSNVRGLQRKTQPHARFGLRAPRKGFPPLDWSADQAWASVVFGPIAKMNLK